MMSCQIANIRYAPHRSIYWTHSAQVNFGSLFVLFFGVMCIVYRLPMCSDVYRPPTTECKWCTQNMRCSFYHLSYINIVHIVSLFCDDCFIFQFNVFGCCLPARIHQICTKTEAVGSVRRPFGLKCWLESIIVRFIVIAWPRESK